MKTAVYCRIASLEGANEGIKQQQTACIAKAQELGYSLLPEHIFTETISGLSMERLKLKELKTLIAEKQINSLIAYSPDRISRNPAHLLLFQREMKQQGCELIFVQK